MKRNLLVWMSLFFFTLSHASEKVIERPSFAAWSSTALEISKIVCSDTATVMHIEAFSQPYTWIKLAMTSHILADGKKYPIRYGIGMMPEKQIWMPETGTYSFQMVFPPLPKLPSEIDFTEGNYKGAFSIWGIRLDGKATTSPLNGKKNPKVKAELGSLAFKPGVATFKGHVTGFNTAMKLGGPIWVMNQITGQYDQQELKVQPDGNFSMQLPINHPVLMNLGCNFMEGFIYIEPGETVSVEVNLPEIYRSQSRLRSDEPSLGEKYYFTGTFAAINNEMMNNPVKEIRVEPENQDAYTQMLNDIHVMDADQIKAYWMGKYEKALQTLEQQDNISDLYRYLLKQRLQISTAEQLVNASNMAEHAYRTVKRIPKDTILTDYAKPVCTDEYYDFFPQLVSNDSILFLNGSCNLIQSLRLNKLPLEKYLGTDKGLLFDLIAIQNIAAPISDFHPLDNEQLAKAETISPTVKQIITQINDKLKQTIEKNNKKYDATTDLVDLTNIPNEQLFNAITSPYKGKVVFVDFWATWRRPCREALKKAEPVKAEMEDKDVVFLYLTWDSSPKGTWEQMITDIKGAHYCVTREQWQYWESKYGVRGVPSYMVLAKDGRPSYFNIGFMGVDYMRQLILEQLNKE